VKEAPFSLDGQGDASPYFSTRGREGDPCPSRTRDRSVSGAWKSPDANCSRGARFLLVRHANYAIETL
jgi:hypothetical protein